MKDDAISILMVEDNPGDARLVQELVAETSWGGRFHFTCVGRLAAGLDALGTESFDVILLDLSLPDSHGLSSLETLHVAVPGIPVVVLTGLTDEDMALRAVQSGAQDYLVKGRGDGDLIRRAIRYAIERNRAEKALRQSEARFRAIFEDTVIGISVVGADATLIDANPALHAMLGYDPGTLRGMSVSDITHPEDRETTLRPLMHLLSGDAEHYTLEKRYCRKSGETIWARINVSLVRDIDRRPLFTVGLTEDITDRKNMEDRLRLAARVFENTSEGIFVTDPQHTIIHVNPAFTELTGFSPDDVIGKKPSALSSGRHDAAFYEKLHASLIQIGKWQGEIWNRKKNGELFAEWLNISAVRNEAEQVINYVAVFSDITSRKQDEERLNYQANHDPLTSLPNRTLFYERLGRALARAHRNRLTVALLFLDLDRFKEVNDTFGHVVGDQLLQQVAERLTGSIRQGDTAARLAGDEFTVILEDVSDFRDVAVIAQKILRRLSEPFALSDHQLTITTSIGISLYPADGDDIHTLVGRADEAMYRAKREGRNTYQFHSDSLNAQAFERLALENSLLHAVERNQFRLHYQPIYDLASGRVVAAEALLRWQHPEIGLALPVQFLSLAEETGLIVPIGRWVLGEACRQLRRWQQNGHPDLRVCVNLSAVQLQQSDIVGSITAALRDTGIRSGSLEVELPEDTVLGAGMDHVRVLSQLRDTGVRISVDDFGTGYTSFGFLRRLPIDSLKIDQSFVRDLMVDDDDAKVITAITAIAHSLNLTVIAEGVETSEQLAFLKKHQCDLAQGFLFNRPLPPDEFEEILARNGETLV